MLTPEDISMLKSNGTQMRKAQSMVEKTHEDSKTNYTRIGDR
jgi:hypothetical protein